MSKLFIIVERKEDWTSYYPSEDVVTAQEYLELPIDDDTGKRVQVINLCRHYKYLRHGYYCSLLAEARGHKVIPSVRTISELARKSLYSLVLEDLDRTLDKALAAHPYGSTDGFTLTLYFGRTDIEPLQDLARQLFEAFPCPLLLVEFKRNRTWHIEASSPAPSTSCARTRKTSSPTPWTASAGRSGASRVRASRSATTWRSSTTPARRSRPPTPRR